MNRALLQVCVLALLVVARAAAQVDARIGGSDASPNAYEAGGLWLSLDASRGDLSCDACSPQTDHTVGVGLGGGSARWRLGVESRYWFEEDIPSGADFKEGDVHLVGQVFAGNRSPFFIRAGVGRLFYHVEGSGGHANSVLGGVGLEVPRGHAIAVALSAEYQWLSNQYGRFRVVRIGASLVFP